MSLRRMSPRVAPTDDPLVPVFPRGRAPRPLGWFIIAFAAIPAVIALLDDSLGFRLVMAALAVTIVVVGIGILVLAGAVRAQEVVVDADAPALRFAPPAAARVPTVVIALALLLPAVAQLVVDVTGLPTWERGVRGMFGAYALGILGLAILVVRIWQLRVPAGLTLSADGLRGIRGVGPIEARWEDVIQVGVVAAPAAKLSLLTRSSRPVLASAAALGSDPNLVAAVIRHYLDHSADRETLAQGATAALRTVEDAR